MYGGGTRAHGRRGQRSQARKRVDADGSARLSLAPSWEPAVATWAVSLKELEASGDLRPSRTNRRGPGFFYYSAERAQD